MAIQDNSPTFSYVKLDGISVTWNNEIFMVKDFATNKKYIYWNADIPNQLNASNTMPNRSTVQHLVLINDNGVSTIVPPTDENFSISFDGNSEQAIKEKIFGLYAKNEEHGEKFIAIEQDIDGIKQIVGETGGSDLSLWERVSKLEQTSDEISISVQENKKEYNDDKEVSQLRENLNSSIIQINSILGIFKSEITECFKDNEVSKEEAEE
ncbi:MAG: tail fiber domain-containing protein, partial [Peptostreptococcaceae bacterium]|nr:tail fiber domain-containing protein [Peptostreptococcaceae bacterium]